jgi:hypothetical protein
MTTTAAKFPSFNWMRGVARDMLISIVHRFVLIRLCLYRDEKRGGQCDPGYQTVADELGVDRATVFRAVDVAIRRGWLAGFSKHGGGTKRNFVFTFPQQSQSDDGSTVASQRPSQRPTVAENRRNSRRKPRQQSQTKLEAAEPEGESAANGQRDRAKRTGSKNIYPPPVFASADSGSDTPAKPARKNRRPEAGSAETLRRATRNAPLLAPITPEKERAYTRLIKTRTLYEGACELSWQQYFEYREVHPECEPLSSDDIDYAGWWTACAVHPETASAGKPCDDENVARLNPTDLASAFAEFWPICPKKVGKEKARKAHRMVVTKRGVAADRLKAAMQRYAIERTGKDQQYTLSPANWLIDGHYDDEPSPGTGAPTIDEHGNIIATPSPRPSRPQSIEEIEDKLLAEIRQEGKS